MRLTRLLLVTVVALALLCVPAGADASPAKASKRVAKLGQCKWAANQKTTAKQRRAATRRCSQRYKGRAVARRTIKRPTTTTTKASAQPQPQAQTQTTATAAATPVATTPMQDELVACTNRERVAAGLPVMTVDPALVRAAQAHAEDMHTRNYFAHDTPEGRTPWQRITAQLQGADPFGTMGENIAKGFAQAQATCDAWMASPSHRANIMNAEFTLIGTGFVGGYAAQDFGGR